MFGGLSAVPAWFYLVAVAVIALIVIITEWKTR